MRRTAPALLLAVCASAFGPASAPAARTATVTLEDIAFTPAGVRIASGDRVRWVWRDGPATPHNVRSRGSRRFRGAGDRVEGTHVVRFSARGTYRYVCTIHAGMDGKITVR